MSPVIVLCGPSGAGKTTLLQAIMARGTPMVDLVPRTTTRPARKGEPESAEYEFTSRDSFISSLAGGEFVDYTEHHGILYGVRRLILEPHLSSTSPAILVSGTNSAIRLKRSHPTQVKVVFVYPGNADDLRRGGISPQSAPNLELFRRLSERVLSDVDPAATDLAHWIDVRMTRNLSRIASILNEMNHGLDVIVIRNAPSQLAEAIDTFEAVLVGSDPRATPGTTEAAPWNTYSNAHLPRKRVGATALYVNHAGQVLIVKPTYRPDWLTPGGTVDEGESPHEGCSREVHEELGNPFLVRQLLCVEYRSAHDRKVENIQFVFWGGELDNDQVRRIRLRAGEIEDFQFCDVGSLHQFLNSNLANRVAVAMKAGAEDRMIYLENRSEPS